MNSMKQMTVLFTSLLLAILSGGACAATVSYVLDQSNALPDGVDYLTVTISDNVQGQLDFWVDSQSPLTDIAGDNFGIQKFAFNVTGDLLPGKQPSHFGWEGNEPPGIEVASEHREYGNSEAHRMNEAHGWRGEPGQGEGQFCMLDSVLMAGDFILPDGWEVQLDKGGRHGGDGFNVRLLGNGNNRQDPLHFYVRGLELEDVLAGFSAHVAGFEFSGDECGEGEHEHGCKRLTSAYFFGARPVVVPLPATAWLLGCGLLGLAAVGRRGVRVS